MKKSDQKLDTQEDGRFERSLDWDDETKINDACDALDAIIELCTGEFGIVIKMHKLGSLLGLVRARLGEVVVGHRDGEPCKIG